VLEKQAQLNSGAGSASEEEEKKGKCWYRRMICSKASNYGISYEAQVGIGARGAHEDKKKGKGRYRYSYRMQSKKIR